MIISEVSINGLKIIEPKVIKDERGVFFESYNQAQLLKEGIADNFLQDNQILFHWNIE